MFPPKSSREAQLRELDRMMGVKLPASRERLTSIQMNQVDALCLGPADPDANARYHAIWPIGWWKLEKIQVIKRC